MKNMVDIEVVLDEKYIDPKVTIKTRENTRQVENIIYAIENASDSDFPQIAAYQDSKLIFVSQKDIVRAYVEGRKVMLQTEDDLYTVKKSLAGLESDLNELRFLRISQSEIINLYKVKCFDFNAVGTVGVEFDCGVKTWASRSRVKDIKAKIKANEEAREEKDSGRKERRLWN
ncbi:LytTR family DNA-binding domain-containing protein [Butyrivibrio sp. AE2032]|uniref:LytTR family DNA-binding domain-containing protein n=1 Tax=Butyrivibrio sp. AE2032 TaxID=1458463 RepID=UPI00068DF972|nr:LytTR family DNA-binding domain-containing protein [Butyrivibrio sp. AE2032]